MVADDRLSFIAADLANDPGWREAGVKRVVLTTSLAAIGYGHKEHEAPFNETDWTDPSGHGVLPYTKSKVLAERTAWNFVGSEGGKLELSVVNPVGVLARVLGPRYSTSILIVQRVMDGARPGCPQIYFGLVDVRDVADMHIRTMSNPAANGERFRAVAGDFVSMLGIAQVLKSRMGAAAKRVPTRQLPNWLVGLAALRDSSGEADFAGTRQTGERHQRKGQAFTGLGATFN